MQQCQENLHSTNEPCFYKIDNPISTESLSHLVHKGVTHIYEGNIKTSTMPEDVVFLLHVRPKLAYETDIVPLLRVFLNQNIHLKPKDPEMALTAIFEGWSNALIWGTLDMPQHKQRDKIVNFEGLLKQRLQDPAFSHRYMTLLIRQNADKIVASIRDQGGERSFGWEEAFMHTRATYKGMSIIRNCCDRLLFDDKNKVIHMEFHLQQ